MLTEKITPGMVFALYDHSKLADSNIAGSHKYLVFGIDNLSPHAMYQCFCITSMYRRRVTYELPIVLQGTVGYVVPSNIHSFSRKELEQGTFIGQLQDTRDIYVHDFLDLCHDMNKAVVCSFLKYDKYYKIIERFDRYCRNFFRNYKDVPEYRYVHKENSISGNPNYKYEPIDEIINLLNENTEEDTESITEEIEVKKVKKIPEPVKKQVYKAKKKQKKVEMKLVRKPENWDELWEEYITWRISTKELIRLLGITRDEWVKLYKEEKEAGHVPPERQQPWMSPCNPYRSLYMRGYARITDDVLEKETRPEQTKQLLKFDMEKSMRVIDMAPYRVGSWSEQVWEEFDKLVENYSEVFLAEHSSTKKTALTWKKLIAKRKEMKKEEIKQTSSVIYTEIEIGLPKLESKKEKPVYMTHRDKKIWSGVERFNKKIKQWTYNQITIAYEILSKYSSEEISKNSTRWNSPGAVDSLKGVLKKKIEHIK